MKLININETNLAELYSLVSSHNYTKFCGERQRDEPSFHKNTMFLINSKIRIKHILIELDNKFVGTIYTYNYNSLDKVAYVTIFIDENSYGVGIKAMSKYLIHLFDEYDLYKVYFNVFSFNQKCLNIVNRLECTKEGHLLNHGQGTDNRYDLEIYGLTQQHFKYLCKKYRWS